MITSTGFIAPKAGWQTAYNTHNSEDPKAIHEGFDKAFNDSPLDPSNHLMYADFLDEQNQSEYARRHRLIGHYLQSNNLTRAALEYSKLARTKSWNAALVSSGSHPGAKHHISILPLQVRTVVMFAKEAHRRSTNPASSQRRPQDLHNLASHYHQESQAYHHILDHTQDAGQEEHRDAFNTHSQAAHLHSAISKLYPIHSTRNAEDPAAMREGFHRAFLESPLDPHNHLIAADWLDENGHSDEASQHRWIAHHLQTGQLAEAAANYSMLAYMKSKATATEAPIPAHRATNEADRASHLSPPHLGTTEEAIESHQVAHDFHRQAADYHYDHRIRLSSPISKEEHGQAQAAHNQAAALHQAIIAKAREATHPPQRLSPRSPENLTGNTTSKTPTINVDPKAMREGFHTEVLKYPQDPSPHLIYADYLEENNNPEEAAIHRRIAQHLQNNEPSLAAVLYSRFARAKTRTAMKSTSLNIRPLFTFTMLDIPRRAVRAARDAHRAYRLDPTDRYPEQRRAHAGADHQSAAEWHAIYGGRLRSSDFPHFNDPLHREAYFTHREAGALHASLLPKTPESPSSEPTTNTVNEEGFLKQIHDEPDSPTPHLIYGDYLEEQGRTKEARAHRAAGLAKHALNLATSLYQDRYNATEQDRRFPGLVGQALFDSTYARNVSFRATCLHGTNTIEDPTRETGPHYDAYHLHKYAARVHRREAENGPEQFQERHREVERLHSYLANEHLAIAEDRPQIATYNSIESDQEQKALKQATLSDPNDPHLHFVLADHYEEHGNPYLATTHRAMAHAIAVSTKATALAYERQRLSPRSAGWGTKHALRDSNLAHDYSAAVIRRLDAPSSPRYVYIYHADAAYMHNQAAVKHEQAAKRMRHRPTIQRGHLELAQAHRQIAALHASVMDAPEEETPR